MESHYSEVVIIDRIERFFNPVVVMLARTLEKLLKKILRFQRMPFLLKNLARGLEKELIRYDFDLLFSPSSLPFTYLKTNVPKVFWVDATFSIMTGYYPDFSNLPGLVKKWGNKQELLALQNVDLAVYASEWAYSSALSDYQARPEKVRMIPMGANLETKLNLDEIQMIIDERLQGDTIRLLSVGANWQRKGFDLTLQVAREVYNLGYKVELALVGALPPREIKVPFNYHHYGRLLKSNPSEFETYQRLYKEAHFFILPSIAECFGVVFAEASSFALPSLARRTGGIPTMVENEVNGFTFDPEASAMEYAQIIVQWYKDKSLYKQLCLTSFSKFVNELDWEKGFGLLTSAISGLVEADSKKNNKPD